MRRLAPAAVVVLGLVLALPAPGRRRPERDPAGPGRAHRTTLSSFVGTWRWMLRTTEAGTTRVEDETWQFRPGPEPTQLIGRYVRTVEVRSDDRRPVPLQPAPVVPPARGVRRRRRDHARRLRDPRDSATARSPAPCDHGFRHVGAYAAELVGDRLRLRWDGGVQTLWQVDAAIAALPEDPWPPDPVDPRALALGRDELR